MSTITTQQSPTPPVAYTGYSAHGSIGPVIGVLAVVLILCAVAVAIGRLCFGSTIMGYGHNYNMESWVESKCSSCVDGRILVSPPPPITSSNGGDSGNEGSSTPVSNAEASSMEEQQSEKSPDENMDSSSTLV